MEMQVMTVSARLRAAFEGCELAVPLQTDRVARNPRRARGAQ